MVTPAPTSRYAPVLAIALFMVSCGTSGAGPGSANPGSLSPAPIRGTVIELNKPIERELLGGQTHTYAVVVPEGHVFSGVVDQRGIDVKLEIVNPSGKTVATVDSPNGMNGPEPWIIEPTPAGTWHIEVTPFESNAKGHYEIRMSENITTAEHAERGAKLRYRSARMMQLWKEHHAEGQVAIERFSKQMQGHAPIVEPIAGDAHGDALITFVYLAEPNTRQVWLGGGPKPMGNESAMLQFEETNLWYLSARVPKDLRITYGFRLGKPIDPWMNGKQARASFSPPTPDPWNPRHLPMSLVELPDAPAQPWTERKEGVAAREIIKTAIKSEILHEDRQIGIYLPPKFDPVGKSYPYVIVFDAEVYGISQDSIVPTPTILDNLIAQGKVPPMVGVLVKSGATRNRDLPMSAPFCDFLAKELVPWLRKEHHASAAPAEATLAGSSFGGLAAAYCAFHHSDVFGNALVQSGSFWFSPGALDVDVPYALEPGALIREVLGAPAKPVRFWMEVGIYEGGGPDLLGTSQVAQNRHMRDVLRAKGYDVSYHEYSGGHDYASWRGSLADGLMALVKKPEKP